MKKLLLIVAVLSVALMSCNPDDEGKAPSSPAGLNASDLTDVSAILTWAGDATIYEVAIGDAETRTVTSRTYKATRLTAETEYTWKVRAKADGLYSEWVDGPAFTTKPVPDVQPDEPVLLEVTDITATSAVFTWQGAAESYELELGTVLESVEATTFTVSGLTPERSYAWRVRAKNGELYSQWTNGPAFITPFAIPANIDFTHCYVANYHADYYGAGTSDFRIRLTESDPEVAESAGWLLALDVCSTLTNEGNGSGYLDIPEGTYEFSSTASTGNIVLGGSSDNTFFAKMYADGTGWKSPAITGGTVSISGNHENYSMTFEIVLADNTTFTSSYNGPILVVDPSTPPEPSFGEIAYVEFDAIGGDDVKNYALRITDDGKVDTGNGFTITLDVYGVGDSATIIPDGTYTVASGTGAWVISLGNYSYITQYKNNMMGAREGIVSGTLTTEMTGTDTYTMTVNLETASGKKIQKTYSGEVILSFDYTGW